MTAPHWQDPRHPDHYHWITSRLDARGARLTVSRLIVIWLGVGGLAPALIMFGSTTSNQWPLRAAGIAVTVVSVLLSVFWIRGGWPTRGQSGACVVIGTALAAATCLLVPNPLLGLMVAPVFTAVATFAAIFHSWHVVAGVMTTAVGISVLTGFRYGAVDPAVAVGLSITTILIIVFVTFVVRALIGLIDTDAFAGAIEPITGLLSRDGFDDGVAVTMATRGRTDDRYLVILVIGLDSLAHVSDLGGPGQARQLRVRVAQMLRDTARRDAVVAHVPESEFLLADVFNSPDPDPLCERISTGITNATPELTASIGAVVTPLTPLADSPPHELTATLVARAGAAMGEARRAGGNNYRIVYVPQLQTSDGEPHGVE